MSDPPDVEAQFEPLGLAPSATRREVGVSTHVLVTNPVWNTGSGYIKRKVANFFVAEGRAKWVGESQLRLIESHPKNRAAKFRAEHAYLSFERQMTEPEKRYVANAHSATRWGRDRKQSIANLDHAKHPSPVMTRIQTKVQTNSEFLVRIMGGVAAYLVIGVTWAFGYKLLLEMIPGAIHFQTPLAAGVSTGEPSRLIYFSFETLTTVSYGDAYQSSDVRTMGAGHRHRGSACG